MKLSKKELSRMTTMELACAEYAYLCKDMKTFKRYCSMLERRAVKFYIEGNLDTSTVEEDLYNCDIDDFEEEEFEKKSARKNYKPSLCNLAFSEKEHDGYRNLLLKLVNTSYFTHLE